MVKDNKYFNKILEQGEKILKKDTLSMTDFNILLFLDSNYDTRIDKERMKENQERQKEQQRKYCEKMMDLFNERNN